VSMIELIPFVSAGRLPCCVVLQNIIIHLEASGQRCVHMEAELVTYQSLGLDKIGQ